MSSPANALLTSGARMVVTRHLDDGTAAFHSDGLVDAFSPLGPALSSFVVFDARPRVPVDNQAAPPADLAKTVPRAPPGGLTFCFTNVAPRHRVPMHRTLSLDYGVVLSGEIVLVLDGGDGGEGEETTLRAGDVIVQQGVSHAWHNRTDEVCRIAFVAVGAEKVRLASGEELEEMMVKLPPPS